MGTVYPSFGSKFMLGECKEGEEMYINRKKEGWGEWESWVKGTML